MKTFIHSKVGVYLRAFVALTMIFSQSLPMAVAEEQPLIPSDQTIPSIPADQVPLEEKEEPSSEHDLFMSDSPLQPAEEEVEDKVLQEPVTEQNKQTLMSVNIAQTTPIYLVRDGKLSLDGVEYEVTVAEYGTILVSNNEVTYRSDFNDEIQIADRKFKVSIAPDLEGVKGGISLIEIIPPLTEENLSEFQKEIIETNKKYIAESLGLSDEERAEIKLTNVYAQGMGGCLWGAPVSQICTMEYYDGMVSEFKLHNLSFTFKQRSLDPKMIAAMKGIKDLIDNNLAELKDIRVESVEYEVAESITSVDQESGKIIAVDWNQKYFYLVKLSTDNADWRYRINQQFEIVADVRTLEERSDANQDGVVDDSDIRIVKTVMIASVDLNANGVFDEQDLKLLKELVQSEEPDNNAELMEIADINQNNKVDMNDLDLMQLALAFKDFADVNLDGQVDEADIQLIQRVITEMQIREKLIMQDLADNYGLGGQILRDAVKKGLIEFKIDLENMTAVASLKAGIKTRNNVANLTDLLGFGGLPSEIQYQLAKNDAGQFGITSASFRQGMRTHSITYGRSAEDGTPRIHSVTVLEGYSCPPGEMCLMLASRQIKAYEFSYGSDGVLKARFTPGIISMDGVVERIIYMHRESDGVYLYDEILELGIKGDTLSATKFSYVMMAVDCVAPGDACIPSTVYSLSEMVRTDANGNELSVIKDFTGPVMYETYGDLAITQESAEIKQDAESTDVMVLQPIKMPPIIIKMGFQATVTLNDGTVHNVTYDHMEDLLEKVRKLESNIPVFDPETAMKQAALKRIGEVLGFRPRALESLIDKIEIDPDTLTVRINLVEGTMGAGRMLDVLGETKLPVEITLTFEQTEKDFEVSSFDMLWLVDEAQGKIQNAQGIFHEGKLQSVQWSETYGGWYGSPYTYFLRKDIYTHKDNQVTIQSGNFLINRPVAYYDELGQSETESSNYYDASYYWLGQPEDVLTLEKMADGLYHLTKVESYDYYGQKTDTTTFKYMTLTVACAVDASGKPIGNCDVPESVMLFNMTRTNAKGEALSTASLSNDTAKVTLETGAEHKVVFKTIKQLIEKARQLERYVVEHYRMVKVVRDDLVQSFGLSEKAMDTLIAEKKISIKVNLSESKATVHFASADLMAELATGASSLVDPMREAGFPKEVNYTFGHGPIPMIACAVDKNGVGDCPVFVPTYHLNTGEFRAGGKVVRMNYLSRYTAWDGSVIISLTGNNRLQSVQMFDDQSAITNCLVADPDCGLVLEKEIDYSYGYYWPRKTPYYDEVYLNEAKPASTSLYWWYQSVPDVTAKITYKKESPVASRSVEFRRDDNGLQIHKITDFNEAGEILVSSEFEYATIVTKMLCPADKPDCNTSTKRLNKIVRKDKEGNEISVIDQLQKTLMLAEPEARELEDPSLQSVDLIGEVTKIKSHLGVITLGTGKAFKISFENFDELLNEALRIEKENEPVVLHTMKFGDAELVVRHIVDEAGVKKMVVQIRKPSEKMLLVYPPNPDPVFDILAEYEITDYKELAGYSSSWYSRAELKVTLANGGSIMFSNTSYGKYSAAYYQMESKTKSETHGDLQVSATYRMYGANILKTAETLIKIEERIWSGRVYTYRRVIQSGYWGYDTYGNLTSETLSLRGADGSSAYISQQKERDGSISYFVQVYEPRKGITFKKTLKDVKIKKEETSDVVVSVTGNLSDDPNSGAVITAGDKITVLMWASVSLAQEPIEEKEEEKSSINLSMDRYNPNALSYSNQVTKN